MIRITTQAVASLALNVATLRASIVKNPFVFGVYDYGAVDGDVVNIVVNGKTVALFVLLTDIPQYFQERLKPGVNRIQIVALSQGISGAATLGIRYSADQVYDKAEVTEEAELTIGESFNTTVGYPQIALCQTVETFPCLYGPFPESAQHVLEALGDPPEPITAPVIPGKVGNPLRTLYPRLLTIDRENNDARRKASTRPYKCPNTSTQDRDEYPPAAF